MCCVTATYSCFAGSRCVGDVFIPDFYLKEGKEDWKEKYEKVVMCPRCNVLLANVSFLIPFFFSLTLASVQNLSG
jgi:hypothetical protein